MANNEFTDEFLNEVASNYHTVAEASRDLDIPYTKLRNALIKNGNLIPKVRHSLPDKDALLDMFKKSPHYYTVAAQLHIEPAHLKQHCIKVGIDVDVLEIMADAKFGRRLIRKRIRRNYACRYNKKGNK